MMRILQKLLLGAAAVVVMTGFQTAEALAEKRIGVLIWTTENHYTETMNGIKEQLKKEGFEEPRVKFTIENAGGNKAKAMEQAQKFAAAKFDMVIALGTFAAIAVTKEIQGVPVIFSMVYDPVESKIAQDWKSSGNNTTGSSNKLPMSNVLNALKQLAPVKRLGVLYTPGEKNSETQLRELQAEESNSQIKVLPVPLTRKEDVAPMLEQVTGAVDALYLAGSSILGETIPAIVEAATKAKIITVTNLEERVEKGILLGVCADSRSVGILAGERAAKVLKGAKPSSLSIGTLKKPDILINVKTAKSGQIQVPPAFLKSATRVIE